MSAEQPEPQSPPPTIANSTPTVNESYTRTLRRVRRAEAEAVAARRDSQEPEKGHAGKDPSADLVGLAFSGGGVRSASFNLGLLQAFFRSGLLKHVDYLSTVSGGGYIGSYLASLTQRKGVQLSRHNNEMRRQLRIGPAQPPRVVEFVRNGKYLNRPESFTNLYVIGLLFNNLAIFSGLALACMFVAFLWRVLDINCVANWIYFYVPPGRFWTELWRPFLPAAVLALLWLACWVGGFFWSLLLGRRPRPRATGPLLVLVAITLLIGLAVVLATPVISISEVGTEENEGVKEISGQQHVLATSIIGVIGAALLPFLQPQRLLRSGLHPKSIWERRIFVTACSALMAGVPFILIWCFAHHDFAGQDKVKRDRSLQMGDVNFRKWRGFWTRVKAESLASRATPGAYILRQINDVEKLTDALEKPEKMSAMAAVPVPSDRGIRDLKQSFVERINAEVIGPERPGDENATTGGFPKRPWFAEAVQAYWYRECGAAPGSEASHLLFQAKVRHHAEAPRILTLLDRLQSQELIPEEVRELNRLLLEVCYPEEILPRTKIYRWNTIDADQAYRAWWLLGLGGAFLVAGCVSMNATSMHSYYRDRLARTFIEPIENDDRTIRLSQLDTTARGAPYPLFSATLNRKPRDRDPSMYTRKEPPPPADHAPESTQPGRPDGSALAPEHPGETPTETFLLSRFYCGSPSLGYRQTGDYMADRLELDDAMAISGAAFSPVQSSNPFIGFLMTVFNMRLGQWLPNPAWQGRGWFGAAQWGPCLHELVWDWLPFHRGQPRTCFLTDGGHHENLGLWPLLERRCKLIIVSDASQDGESGFADLLRVVRRARFEKGITFHSASPAEAFRVCEDENEVGDLLELLWPEQEQASGVGGEGERPHAGHPLSFRRCRRHFFFARIDYPGGSAGEPCEGYLIYLKPTMTGDESPELRGYAALNADFPHNPTLDQLYDEDRFESYRQLGEHVGERLCQELCGDDCDPEAMWEWGIGAGDLLAYCENPDGQTRALEQLRADRAARRPGAPQRPGGPDDGGPPGAPADGPVASPAKK